MKTLKAKNVFPLLALCLVCFGCSAFDSLKKSMNEGSSKPAGESNSSNSSPGEKTDETAAGGPCANKYNPVKDGSVKRYKMSIGNSDTKIVQQYTEGATNFTEVLTVGTTTVTHNWECTSEGLIAANPGSNMNSKDLKLEPKHISGVTLPKDSELKIGKTWTTVYTESGSSPLGPISANLRLNNKVVAEDEQVTVPGGTFKTIKVEINIDLDMKMGKTDIPKIPVKSYAWYAPGVGLVKSAAGEGTFGNSTMDYAGDQ